LHIFDFQLQFILAKLAARNSVVVAILLLWLLLFSLTLFVCLSA